MNKRLYEEFEKLDVRVNTEKTKVADLTLRESFDFLGFNFRRCKTKKGKWELLHTPPRSKRISLLANLREVFRRHKSQPIDRVIDEINPILRGWTNYFLVGNSSQCFCYVRDWTEKKIRRHLMKARGGRVLVGRGGVGG